MACQVLKILNSLHKLFFHVLCKESSINDASALGRESMFCDDIYKAVVKNSVTLGEEGIKNCPKLRDIIYGRPLTAITFSVAQRLDNSVAAESKAVGQISREPKIDSTSFDEKQAKASSLSFSAGNQTYDVVLASNTNKLSENFTNRITVEQSVDTPGSAKIFK